MNFIKRIPLSIRPIEDMVIWIKIQSGVRAFPLAIVNGMLVVL